MRWCSHTAATVAVAVATAVATVVVAATAVATLSPTDTHDGAPQQELQHSLNMLRQRKAAQLEKVHTVQTEKISFRPVFHTATVATAATVATVAATAATSLKRATVSAVVVIVVVVVVVSSGVAVR